MNLLSEDQSPIGFKDWDVVCQAMGAGTQSVILRKGGLAEGRNGFQWRHRNFFLFPTQYHEQMQKVRQEFQGKWTLQSLSPDSEICIRYFFKVEEAHWVDSKEKLYRLYPFHIYTQEVIDERFSYNQEKQGEGITVAFGRTYRLDPVWQFADSPKYGGCRSWLEKLPCIPKDLQLSPILSDTEYKNLLSRFKQTLA